MARIRSVKPEICESETMARLSAEVERTFVRLWTHLDDHGRAKDNPHLIVAALFPLHADVTAAVVDQHLAALAAEGLIVRYEVDGTRYLACPSWAEHQHPQKPRPSKIPEPPVGVPDVSRTPTVAVAEQSGPVVGEVGVGVEVSVEGEGLTPPSLRTTPVDEQQIRRAAVAVGRVLASDAADPAAYAASITRRILTGDDPTDRERISAALSRGESVETIAAGWEPVRPDWLTYAGSGATSGQADGPDTAGFYAGREALRREQMQDQEPADPVVAREAARVAREALRAPVTA